MRTNYRLTVVSSLVACTLPSADVAACKVSRVASAVDITDLAEVILLVKVPDVEVKDRADIEMEVVEVVKGEFKKETIKIQGQTAHYYGPNDKPVPYDFVRKGGRRGSCYASDYKRNGQFLLFLRKGSVRWAPLAATNEEVSGSADPWVVWVKTRLGNQPNKNGEKP